MVALMIGSLLSGCGGGSGAPFNVTAPAANNTATVTVGSGPLGQSGGIVNGMFTSITICKSGTQNCATVDNVLVDTGSLGVRLLSSAVGSLALSTISSGGNPLEECVQFGDTSYAWGSMVVADVKIAGESAPQIPVQILGGASGNAPASCLTVPVNPNLPNGGNLDTQQSLGANGILGIGNGGAQGPWDCGSFCATNAAGSRYYLCPGGTCQQAAVPTNDQSTNPIAAFISSDTNGLVITLPAVGATGSSTVSGTMSFGVGTQSDNAIASGTTLYAMDQCDDFPTIAFNSVNYTDTFCNTGTGTSFGGFLDTGSNGLFISDATTLASFGISDCASNTSGFGFYCVSGGGTTSLSNIALSGNGGVGSGKVTLNIESATTLVNTNNAVFNDLGSDSGTGPSSDFFDFGLPFFLGRTVAIGITGATGQSSMTSARFGFVAF